MFSRVAENATGGVDSDDASFEDVLLCTYDSNRDVGASENLGTFDGSAEYVDISITTASVPDLVLIHHPRFHSINDFQLGVLEYIDENNRFRELNSHHVSFPYGQLERGTCAPSP